MRYKGEKHMTDEELLQQALDALISVWNMDKTTKQVETIQAIKARLAQPESLLNSVHCQCGASWTYENGALNYKPFKDENK